MLVLRSILFNVCFYVSTPLIAICLICVRPFGVEASWYCASIWSDMVQWLLRVICQVHVHIEGKENLPTGSSVVLVNHQSALETALMPRIVPSFVWVLKRELLFIPIFGWSLIALQAIAIWRAKGSKAMKQVMIQGKQFLSNGRWVVIFPEGTRVAIGEKKDFRAGGVLLAKAAEVNIVPVAHNSGLCWPRKSFMKYPGHVYFRILEAIPAQEVKEKKANALLKQVQQCIEEEKERIATMHR
ncbi:MAG: lysophospholipid acyltransferase family protein [Mariprofundaceae bacterium]|nr:lysophospholipid acyltransferase family protein [Mariprofundaceae bacterium]